MANVLEKFLRIGEGTNPPRLKAYASAINDLEDDFASLTDEELQDETKEAARALRERRDPRTTWLPEALPRSVRRHRSAPSACGTSTCSSWWRRAPLGNIAEMKTGEGKTLVATTAAYLNAIPSAGVHVITVNDFSRRTSRSSWAASSARSA